MLPSCGHFKNIPCPFYKLALCVRPHCLYKHQNTDNYQPRQILSSLVDETESLFDSKINEAQKRTFDLSVSVKQENFTYIPTPVEADLKPPGILKLNNSYFEKSSTSYVPEYKPTPISKLKECTLVNAKLNKKEYSPEYPTTLKKKKNVEEYDPTEVKCVPKKTVTFVDCSKSSGSEVPIVLISSDEELDSENAPKFSDDDFEEELSLKSNFQKLETNKTLLDVNKKQENEIEVIEINEFSIVDQILVDSKKNEMLLKAKVKSKPALKDSDTSIKLPIAQKQDKNRIYLQDKTEIKNKQNDRNAGIKIENLSSNTLVSKIDGEIKEPSSDIKEEKKNAVKNISKRHKELKKKADKIVKYEGPACYDTAYMENLKKDSKQLNDKSKYCKKILLGTKRAHSYKTSKIDSQTVSDQSSEKLSLKKKSNEGQIGKPINSGNEQSFVKSKYFENNLSSESNKIKEGKLKHLSSVKRKLYSDLEISNSEQKYNKKKSKCDDVSVDIQENDSNDFLLYSVDKDNNLKDDISLNCDILSSCSESDPDEECRRIFNECYPDSSELSKESKKESNPIRKEAKATDLVILRKKRYAHSSAADFRKPVSQKKMDIKRPLNPSQVMFNRFAQCQAKFLKQNGNKVDVSSKSSDKKRLNFVPNHSLLAAVKSKLNQNNSLANFSPLPSTVTKTLKVTQRVAHIPEAALKPRPIIPANFGSKVPSNIRQKFLNAFIDECLKFSTSEDAAYDLGIEEEKKAYERSSSKSLYMNVAANTLKRLRTQVKEGFKVNINSSSGSKKGIVSHEVVLNGPLAQRRSFSIGRKKQAFDIKDLGGLALYEHLLQYLLTPEQLKENGFPQPHPNEKDRAIIEGVYTNRSFYCNDAFKRTCCRCQKIYYVNVDGDYVRDEECDFHWGRLWKKRIAGSIESRYSCCQGDSESNGCCVSIGHVFEGSESHALRGFVRTLPKTPPQDNFYGIYSLDCEMCYTTAGMELTRVTVIDTNLKPVYESFVKPQHKVLDYNTRFSGITEDDLKNVKTTIHDVQAVMLCIFNTKTILIGHSLESDFKALKIFHNTVVDTSVVFPHKNGLPFKRALRTLMAEKLNKIIQNDVGGHDSHEDAVACMELILWKIKEDMKGNR